MAQDGLYFLDTTYNSSRDAWEVNIAFMVDDEDVKGRYKSVKVTVNIPNHKKEESLVKELALQKARAFLKTAADAPLESE